MCGGWLVQVINGCQIRYQKENPRSFVSSILNHRVELWVMGRIPRSQMPTCEKVVETASVDLLFSYRFLPMTYDRSCIYNMATHIVEL
jgi:hypothetical protein